MLNGTSPQPPSGKSPGSRGQRKRPAKRKAPTPCPLLGDSHRLLKALVAALAAFALAWGFFGRFATQSDIARLEVLVKETHDAVVGDGRAAGLLQRVGLLEDKVGLKTELSEIMQMIRDKVSSESKSKENFNNGQQHEAISLP